jgi:hypothetical protein
MKSILRLDSSKKIIFVASIITLIFTGSLSLYINYVQAENQNEIREEVITAFSQRKQMIRPGFTILSCNTSYLILAMGQTQQERMDGLFFPPYSLEIWIDNQPVELDSFMYYDRYGEIGNEPTIWWIFYHVYEADTFLPNTWHSLKYIYSYWDLNPRIHQEAVIDNVGFWVVEDISDQPPKFVNVDYTELDKVTSISRFRSGIGHDYSDSFELCRSMKHYYVPFDEYRDNYQIQIFSPVDGVIDSIVDEQHGHSGGLINRQIRIKSDLYLGITIVLFHIDLISNDIQVGKHVNAGELLGFAHMYYPELNEFAHDFDIAVWFQSQSGLKYVSYFDIIIDELLQEYINRGVTSRSDLIISQEERDNDPLQCDEDGIFLDPGTIPNWVDLTTL